MIMASIALSTTMGVLIHDSQIDRASIAALSIEARTDAEGKGLFPELHVHGEHTKVSKRQARIATPDPRDQMKNRNQKKTSGKFRKSGQAYFYQPA